MVLKKQNKVKPKKFKLLLLILMIVTLFLFSFLLFYGLNHNNKNTEVIPENNNVSATSPNSEVTVSVKPEDNEANLSVTPQVSELSITPTPPEDDINVSEMLKHNEIKSWDDISKTCTAFTNGQLTQEAGKVFIDIFVDYLNKNPKTGSEDILKLTPFMKIFDVDSYRVLEFSENPEYYGTSGSNSYQILVNDESAHLLRFGNTNNDDLDFTYDIEKCYLEGNEVIIFGRNHIFTNISGIFVTKINLENYKTENAIGNIDSKGFYYYDDDLSLYYKGDNDPKGDQSYLYFTDIDKSSFTLSLLGSEKDIEFIFNYHNGHYELIE